MYGELVISTITQSTVMCAMIYVTSVHACTYKYKHKRAKNKKTKCTRAHHTHRHTCVHAHRHTGCRQEAEQVGLLEVGGGGGVGESFSLNPSRQGKNTFKTCVWASCVDIGKIV